MARPLTPEEIKKRQDLIKKFPERGPFTKDVTPGRGKPKPGTPGVKVFDDSGMARKTPPGYTNPVPTRDKTGKPLPVPTPTPVKPGKDRPKPVPTPVKPGRGKPTPGKPTPVRPGTPVLYSGSGMKRGGTVKGKK